MLQPSLATQASHGLIYKIVANITPFDKLESEHIQSTLAWIESGVPIFRIQKPDVPNKHLVSYFVLFDEEAKKVLLVDHKKALAWLPTGGHIEYDEHPKDAATRECSEELGINAEFWSNEPLFLTTTETTGLTAGHTDVSLWYVIKGNHLDKYRFDRDEFYDIKWFAFDEIPYNNSDPHIKRFIEKLQAELL
jgi:8-oxo-dGTP diphosphatase